MCGIAGYYGPSHITPERVAACLELMRRRGPDASGEYRHIQDNGRKLTLLHSRLSIIDLDHRSDQPLQRGSLVLACNGEIYNYLELKNRLKSLGHHFDTSSDTEVLLRALEEWGAKGLEECEGMWAFALYNAKDGTLLLCRDRFGEKPLYLHRDGDGLYFASEVKFLAALAGKRFAVNLEQAYSFLVNGYKSLYKRGRTFFRGVEELPAAHLLRLSPGGEEAVSSYWRPGPLQEKPMSFDEAVEGAREKLIRAVELRLRADVPLAFCMSGGVDSNALISIAKRVLGHDVHGFTIVDTDARYDELEAVQASVHELGIRHTTVPTNTSGFLDGLRELVSYHDAPVYTVSYYAHWLLMRAIREQGYKISISGTGADELFTGYYDHYAMYLHEVHDNQELYQRSLDDWKRHVGPVVRNPLLQDPEMFVRDPRERGHIYLDADCFAARLKTDFREAFAEESFEGGLLRGRMHNELFHEVVPVILHEDDLNAMYHSIENRSPFLDRNIYEFCQAIPTRLLIREGYNKAVLREAVRGIAPDVVVNNRRKVGFNASIHSFLDVADEGVRQALLDESPIFEHVRRREIESLLARESLPNSESKFLFSFLGLKMFLEEFGT